MNEISAQFAFKFCEYTSLGYSMDKAFIMAGNEFKKEIRVLARRQRKSGNSRLYFFSDSSSCCYNIERGFFNFKS